MARFDWTLGVQHAERQLPSATARTEMVLSKYDLAPMPCSIFFNEGYAIHGSYEVSRLGRPASHGCIRLSPSNAAVLFALVKDRTDDTRIVVTGEAPVQRYASARRIGKVTKASPMKYF